ncbi:MAG TPA: hypothetical protein VKV40_10290 [Ktedonobacteraceae bacterium]|nr:hypothetical protein [Ktedonobacteraceae bacterium]
MAIHPEKLRWLLWLRWKQFYRGFIRNRSRIIGVIFMVIFGLPFIAGIAALTFLGYRFLPPPASMGLLYLALIGMYMAWIVLPLLEYNVNEGLDLSKLSLFPLTHAELMTSLVLSTLLDIPTLALLLMFAAVVAGWAISVPVALFAVLAMFVFYIQVVGMSQLVLALLMRTLQSRRFRDLSIIIIILFSSSCGILGQFAGHFARGVPGFLGGVAGAISILQWLPPGMAARSIQQAIAGSWGLAFVWLVMLMAVNILVLYLWQAVIERALTSPEEGGTVTRRYHEHHVETTLRPERATTRFWERLLSPQVLAIAGKEAKYFWRDPQLKALIFQSIISGVFFIVWPLIGFGGRSEGGLVSYWLVLFAPLAVFFFMLSLSFNSLGMERQSLTELFLFPVEPQRILWGKNLTVFLMGLIELVVLVLAASLLSHDWNLTLPTLVVGLAGIGVTLGCGNFTSVFFPQPMRQIQRGFRATGASSSGNGCLRGIMSLIMLVVSAIVLIPVILAFGLPIFFHVEWIWVFAIPLALLYGIAFHQAVSRLVAVRMLAREPEILALTTRNNE